MAPLIAGLLKFGLPLLANGVLAKGEQWVKEKTGVDLTAALGSEEGRIKLRQAELDHEIELLRLRQEDDKLAVELEKIYVQDRGSARERDSEFVKAGRWNFRADILAFLAVGSLCFCVYLVWKEPNIPAGVREAIMFIAGVFAAAVRDVYAFEFGSSRGSKEKTDTIDKLLTAK